MLISQVQELAATSDAFEYAYKIWTTAHKRGPQFYQQFLQHCPEALEHLALLREGFAELGARRGGEVYACTHEAYPGQVKIGMTARQAGARVRELRTAGIVGEHRLEGVTAHFDAVGLEARLHAYFKPMRVEREWFRARLPMVLALMERFKVEDESMRSALGA